MAYDAATGTVVMFGGETEKSLRALGSTWTWDGTTWTKQHPAVQPAARSSAAMAYDAATGTVVLFGGYGRGVLFDGTWTWDGTTWTKQHTAVHPPAQEFDAMAYDAATGTVVLFGGYAFGGTSGHIFGDTWTWDGTTWTKQHPAVSPPARAGATLAYDAATGTVVLFGGNGNLSRGGALFGDTWTWDGTAWTDQAPATSPPSRYEAAMTYDAATGTVVLFGGYTSFTQGTILGDTWTWVGTTWTDQAPATSPAARYQEAMAYDAATGTAVLFGGQVPGHAFGDTWTWDG